jgi:hypothetical protein
VAFERAGTSVPCIAAATFVATVGVLLSIATA